MRREGRRGERKKDGREGQGVGKKTKRGEKDCEKTERWTELS